VSPDDFTMAFFPACWDVIKDVIRVFHDFHARGKLAKKKKKQTKQNLMLLLLLSFRKSPRLLMFTILDLSVK